jgi:hypothetical protein
MGLLTAGWLEPAGHSAFLKFEMKIKSHTLHNLNLIIYLLTHKSPG